MTINSQDALLAAFKPGYLFQKATVNVASNGVEYDMFLAPGTITPTGATPPAFTAGSGYTCDNTTLGAIPFVNGSGDMRIARLSGISTIGGYILLYDRLWTCSGFACNITTEQSVTTPGALPARDEDGATAGRNVWAMVEYYSAPGATSFYPTIKYVDSDNAPAQLTLNTVGQNHASSLAGRVWWMQYPVATAGIKQVTSVTMSANSTAVGNMGVTLIRPLAVVPVHSNTNGRMLDYQSLCLPKLYSGSCLSFTYHPNAATTGHVSGMIHYARE